MQKTYSVRPIPQNAFQPRRKHRGLAVSLTMLLLVAIYCCYALLRPLPAPQITITPPVTPAQVKVNVPWPTETPEEQAAYGAAGYGLLASNGPQTPKPTASVAKVVTALVILQKKPLAAGQQGPDITFSQADVDLYNQYVAKDGSVVPIAAGQTISEYKALQALMLPSANNIADSLVIWAFGSMAAYTAYANTYVKQLGMSQTTITDASGFAPETASTARDLIKLGLAANKHPVLAEIASQKTAIFPGYGTIYNVNSLLGQSGITGLKTGNTDEAGGVFLGTADVVVGGKTIKLVTAVMAAPNLASALRATMPLVQTAPAQFHTVHVVRQNEAIGRVTTEWGASSAVAAARNINITAWSGTTLPPVQTQITSSNRLTAGSTLGSARYSFQDNLQTADLKLVSNLSQPSIWWQLSHPF